VRRAAAADTGVLVVAERGSDARSVAHEIHRRGRAASTPWIEVDCGAGDAAWFDRVVFGVVQGQVPADLESVSPDSLIASARNGALFLQDVVELPASAQARLARIARDREVRIDGFPVATGMRVLATAAPSIDLEVREHRFRADLYRRLAGSRIDLPALVDRASDVPELAERVLDELTGGTARVFTQAALALLGALSWPGNIGELRGVVERAAANCGADGAIQVEHVLPALNLDRTQARFAPAGNLREARLRFEREYIAAVLQHHGWRMAEAAHTLGIQRPNLYRKARQLGIPVARLSE
jgi:DNA-binding NtrC family response regulator